MADTLPTTGMPSKDRPDSEKDWRYVVEVMKAVHHSQNAYRGINQYTGTTSTLGTYGPGGVMDVKADSLGITDTIYRNWVELAAARTWMNGTDSGLEYKEVHRLDSSTGTNIKSSRNISWATTKWHLRVVDSTINNMRDRATDRIVTAMDMQSVDNATREKFGMKSRIVNMSKPRFKAQAEAMGVGEDFKIPADQPQDLLEWQVWAGNEIKGAMAQAVEEALGGVDAVEDYHQRIRPQIAEELFATGVLIMASFVNANGFPVRKVVRLQDAILPRTTDNWQNPELMGFYEWLTDYEIFQRTTSLDEAQRKRITKMCMANGGYDQYSGTAMSGMYARAGRVRVMTLYFMDYNHFVAGDDAEGYRVQIDPADAKDYTNVKSTAYEVSYQGSWIVDTGTGEGRDGLDPENGAIHWGCGLSYGQIRMRNAIGRVRLPMCAKAVRMSDMRVKAPAAIGREHYATINHLTMQIRNMVNSIAPPGAIIDVRFFNGVLGDDGKQELPSNIIKAWQDNNIMLVHYGGTDDPDNPTPSRKELRVELTDARIPDLGRLIEYLRAEMQLFEMAMGYNDASVGNTLEERNAARNVQVMMEATDRSHNYLYQTMDAVEQEISLVTYGQIQNLVRNGGKFEAQKVATLYGEVLPKVVSFTEDVDPGSIGLKLEVRMTEAERARIKAAVDADYAKGAITVDDYIAIQSIPNLKQQAAFLKSRREMREREAHARQLEVITEDTKKIQASAEAQGKLQQENAAMIAEQKDKEMDRIHAHQLELQDRKHADSIEAIEVSSMKRIEELAETFKASLNELVMKLTTDRQVAAGSDATKERVEASHDDAKIEVADISADARKAAKPKGD